MVKIIIARSRSFDNYNYLYQRIKWVLQIEKIHLHDIEVVCGMAKGADKLGEDFAIDHLLQVKYFPADWEKYGKQAGFIRNKQMVEYCDYCICFYDGQSKGTKMMINLAIQYNKPTYVFNYNKNQFYHYIPR